VILDAPVESAHHLSAVWRSQPARRPRAWSAAGWERLEGRRADTQRTFGCSTPPAALWGVQPMPSG